ncbi:MAG: Hsp20/alpha crystallin family protein [Desulfuromonadaceae bacterium]|nr:Hsp20/alpha crystallin family protein [Desulfuromonadaceae bacterium]MDD2856867.1 Hsp20/alpha crystallin family protein [Desulfuromonadaceae bacterium]
MSHFSSRKTLSQGILRRNIGELRELLYILELRDAFEDSENRPRMDMYETSGDIVIEFDLPGIRLDAISLKMRGMTLILEASKPREHNEGKFICVERCHGHFNHAVHIPGNVDPGAIRAEYRRGVLRVICPKRAELLIPIKEL